MQIFPAPGGPFSNYFYIQNQTGSSITCIYTIYTINSFIVYNSKELNIAANESKFIDLNSLGLETDTYTAVANCSGKAAIVSNIGDSDSGSGYLGSTGSAVWYLPGLYDNYYNYYSTVIFQNATSNYIDVTLEIYQANSSIPVLTLSYNDVSAYSYGYFELEGRASLLTNQTYSGRLTGSDGHGNLRNVVPMVNIYGRGGVDGQLYSYNGFSNGAMTSYAPVVMKDYYGYNTSINIQNTGDGPTDVTVYYSTGDYQSKTIQAKAAWSIYVLTQGPPWLPSGPSGLFGATIVSYDYPIVVLVNESNIYKRAASYSGQTGGYRAVYAPVLDKRYSSFNSSVTCQMISGGPKTISIGYYTGSTLQATEVSPSKANGEIHMFYPPNNIFLPNGWHGSAKIYSDGYVICIINQDRNEPPYSTYYMDKLYSHESIP